MDTPEEDRSCCRCCGGDSAAPQHQESCPVFGYLSNLYPLDSVEFCLQAGDPGPEIAAPTVDDVKPLLGSTWAEQASLDHGFGRQDAVQRFNISPDVYQDWHQGRFFSNQEVHPHHHATRRHLNFDAVMPCHSSTPRNHDAYAEDYNYAGYSSGVPPTSLPNFGHSLLSNGGPQESSSWQQISDAIKMFQYPSDQEMLIQMPDDSKSSFVFSNPTGEVSDLVGYGQHGDGATDTLKSWSSVYASNLQDHERVAEPNSDTPRRGRRKAEDAVENGGCKRCNCRRSKCLKLYCECFAAGVYCIGSCACEGCYNSLDFEDTVLETRRQIGSRNSLAFGPKVVQQHAINSPPDKAEGSGSEAGPSSVRHVRGCNCKKSQCLKRYCECYQAMAGCSHECNCEDCCNPFSPKAADQRIERREMSPHGTLDSMQGMPNTVGTGTGGWSVLTWEGPVNLLNNTPSPSPLAYSSSTNTSGCSSSTQAERYQGTVPLHLPCSPIDMPPSDGDTASHDLVGVSTTRNMAEGVNISNMGTPPLSRPVNASSPTPRRASALQFRSPGRSPSISPSSRRARRLDSRARPSPDDKSKGGSSQA